jgi:hypothetical protein
VRAHLEDMGELLKGAAPVSAVAVVELAEGFKWVWGCTESRQRSVLGDEIERVRTVVGRAGELVGRDCEGRRGVGDAPESTYTENE